MVDALTGCLLSAILQSKLYNHNKEKDKGKKAKSRYGGSRLLIAGQSPHASLFILLAGKARPAL